MNDNGPPRGRVISFSTLRQFYLQHPSKGILALCILYGASYGKHSPNHV